MGIDGNVSSMNGKIFRGGAPHGVGKPNHTRRSIFGVPLRILIAGFLAASIGSSVNVLGAPANRVPERLLVKPKHAVPETTLQSVFAAHGAKQLDTIHQLDVRVL